MTSCILASLPLTGVQGVSPCQKKNFNSRRNRSLHVLLGVLIASACLNTPALATEGRHALIIGIGKYAPGSGATELEGVPADMQIARRMAKAMGVDDSAIVEIRDAAATKANIVARLGQLSRKVQQGDRVFVYISGHGTKWLSPSGGCEEGVLTYDQETISEKELANFTGPMSQRADKLVMMIDACFSGGVLSATRSIGRPGGLSPKFFASRTVQDACSLKGVNQVATRSLLGELKRFGIRDENFVQIAAANRDEVSWDEPGKGGLATQAVSRCLLGEAQDLNASGAISLDEVRACAQKIMNQRMAPHRGEGLLPSTLQISGNRNLVVAPTVITKPPPSATQTVAIQSDPPTAPPVVSPPPPPVPPPVPVQTTQPPPVAVPVKPPPVAQEPVGPLATIREIYQQRDPRRSLVVAANNKVLRIGQDKLRLTVKSAVDGYVYAVLLGSDQKSFYLLFPNKIDSDNRIKANQTLQLPRPSWDIVAGGPPGTDTLLIVVTQSPRDPKIFVPDADSGGGTFTYALTDLRNRQRLVDFFVGKGVKGRSASMTAAMIEIEETR